jgi:hypothetical protein
LHSNLSEQPARLILSALGESLFSVYEGGFFQAVDKGPIVALPQKKFKF